MVIFNSKTEIAASLEEKRRSGKKIGFVPTMGALHAGHLSLIERAKKENDLVVVSIFVNPAQFNNPDDLKNYPRTIEADEAALKKANTDVLFFPSVEEMYPPGETGDEPFEFGDLETVMEGKHRPGHFKGVALVVSRLFIIIQPNAAYFGEKDFQQLAIIRELAKKMNTGIAITGCPTIRETDGLAMSSRNLLLKDNERKEADKISKALFFIRDNRGGFSIKEIRYKAIEMVEQSGMMKVEYLEIAEEKNLQPVNEWPAEKNVRAFAAVKLGNIRLIDNVPVSN
ncbi:MAG: pantoate--beta-alanine ligase [Bacteroidetes bacterium]|nr:pantoate--beta-alanine ligase [Bacteroidota bacterium]